MLDHRYETLAILAKTQSYTKTANQLFITQPAVSQQIAGLEAELNLELVHKVGNKIELTATGKDLVQYVTRIAVESHQVLERLAQQRSGFSVTIGSTLSLSHFLLPDLIIQLTEQRSKIQTVIGNTAEVLEGLRSGQIQFGIVEGNFDKTEFDAIQIRSEPFVGVTYATNPILKMNQLSVADCLLQPLLIREKGSGTRAIFASWLATQNYQIADFQQQIELSNPATIIECLKRGMGISFMYKSLVKPNLVTGELRTLPMRDFKVSHPINLIYLKDSYFAPAYQKIAQQLKKPLGEGSLH